MELIEIINKEFGDRDFSIYATSNFVKGFMCNNDIELDEESECVGILDTNNYVVLSRCPSTEGEKTWVLAELIKKDNKQYLNEIDVVFIQEEILEIVDLSKIRANEIVIFHEEEVDEVDGLVEDIVSDLVAEIENSDECPCYLIKMAIRDAYETGRNDGLLEAMDKIEGLLGI